MALCFWGYPVVGNQQLLQASGACRDSTGDDDFCPWDPRVLKGEFFFENSFGIALCKVTAFIEDVKGLISLEPKSMCGTELYDGIMMRYVKASSAYLGRQEDGISFDITYYRSHDPSTPHLFGDILEEVEQIALFKYEGEPHWGKNCHVSFEGVMNKYKNAAKFLKVKERYEPLGLFSNDWTDRVLGLKGNVTVAGEGCALEGLCICSDPRHCAPSKGYVCKEGKIYAKASVCTPKRHISTYVAMKSDTT